MSKLTIFDSHPWYQNSPHGDFIRKLNAFSFARDGKRTHYLWGAEIEPMKEWCAANCSGYYHVTHQGLYLEDDDAVLFRMSFA